MRREPTRAERQLWKALREAPLRFRRQAPFGPFIVDFVCHSARLIVEVDGDVHELEAVRSRDMARETWLLARGYDVLRVTNGDAFEDTEAVVRRIMAAVRDRTPTPNPSPQGGGGR